MPLFLHAVRSLPSHKKEREPKSIQEKDSNPEKDLNSWVGPACLLALLGRGPARIFQVEPYLRPLLLSPLLDVGGEQAKPTPSPCTVMSSQPPSESAPHPSLDPSHAPPFLLTPQWIMVSDPCPSLPGTGGLTKPQVHGEALVAPPSQSLPSIPQDFVSFIQCS